MLPELAAALDGHDESLAFNRQGDHEQRVADVDAGRLAAMDSQGIGASVIALTPPGTQVLGADEAVRLSRAANDTAGGCCRTPSRSVARAGDVAAVGVCGPRAGTHRGPASGVGCGGSARPRVRPGADHQFNERLPTPGSTDRGLGAGARDDARGQPLDPVPRPRPRPRKPFHSGGRRGPRLVQRPPVASANRTPVLPGHPCPADSTR